MGDTVWCIKIDSKKVIDFMLSCLLCDENGSLFVV